MKKLLTIFSLMLISFLMLFSAQKDALGQPGLAAKSAHEAAIIHYWHFNTLSGTVTEVESDFSAVGLGLITYPGTGDGYMDERTHRAADPVSNFNLRMGQEPDQGAVLRVRNPSDTRELIIAAPSTGYENLVVTFATTRTDNGAPQQEFYFTPDAGDTWVLVGEAYDIPVLDPTLDDFGYLHKVIDLSEYEEVNDNSGLHFKILFVGEGAANTSGNNRFDNLTLDGTPVVVELELVHYWHFNTLSGTVTEVESDFSAVGLGLITYPGTGDGYMDERTHRAADPVSNFNLRMGQEPDQGAVLRVRNPSDTRELIIAAPSTGYENLVVTFATTRTDNGAQQQEFYFTPDAGDTWVLVGEAYDIPVLDPTLDDFGYLHKVIDLSEYVEVNDNSGLHFKILFVGEGAANTSGNNRFDNLTLDGSPVQSELPVSALHITSINQGELVYVNETFSITVQAVNEEGLPTAAESAIEVSLSLETGTGNLGGTMVGTIEAGTTSVLIEGLTYDVAEAGVSITASASDLTSATSDLFEVITPTYNLTLESFPPGAGTLTGAGVYEAGAEVLITATASEGFAFVNWSDGDDVLTAEAEYTLTMPAGDLTLTANFQELGDVLLIHYWHFNTLSGTVTEVESDFSLIGQGLITYPGSGDGYMDARTYNATNPVSNFNLRLGQEPDQGAVLRVRNPSDTRMLLIAAPSTGFTDLMVMFAATRTENGSQEQEFYFSADEGETWVLVGEAYYIPFYEDEEEDAPYVQKVIDLSGYPEVNDNPDLQFKVLFVGAGNDNLSGNNRFDNLSLDGRPLDPNVSVSDIQMESLIQVYPNPARNTFNIKVEEPGMIIRIFNINGQMVFQQRMESELLSLDAGQFGSGVYIVQGISANRNVARSMRLIIQ
ncbi:MAG: T9SS type A sorting domain-containing protein [Bacteroidales bacterium]|nr:T9SS type A sorting domain-containing protein [Bacteroidales bacterium]